MSVVLPTVEWTGACDDVAEQLRPDDELFVVCDAPTDPVTEHDAETAAVDPEAAVRVVVAGEPEGCSGKANAVAHACSRARHDRLVWTDADFRHGPGWLDRLVAAGERHGPATAVPVFRGGRWWRLVEPWAATLFSLPQAAGVGAPGRTVWAGGVTFTRSEVEGGVPALVAALRSALSDDGVLTDCLVAPVYPVRSMVTPVHVPGDAATVARRLHRFVRIAHCHAGVRRFVPLVAATLGACLFAPLVVGGLCTLGTALALDRLGVPRRSAAFAVPGLVVLLVALVAGVVRSEVVWAGRRYRYRDAGSVSVLDTPARERRRSSAAASLLAAAERLRRR